MQVHFLLILSWRNADTHIFPIKILRIESFRVYSTGFMSIFAKISCTQLHSLWAIFKHVSFMPVYLICMNIKNLSIPVKWTNESTRKSLIKDDIWCSVHIDVDKESILAYLWNSICKIHMSFLQFSSSVLCFFHNYYCV